MPSVAVSSGASICASSPDAQVTLDRNEVIFDNPQRGPGWNQLVSAAGRPNSTATFTVTVTTGEGVALTRWSNQFKCITANNQQVHMSRPLPAPARRPGGAGGGGR